MEMVHVLPRWPDMTMEVDIEGAALVTAVEATAQAATARGATVAAEAMVAEATEAAEAMVVEATGAAPTPFGGAIEEVPEVATEVVQEETTEGPGDSSKEGAGGAMGVATLGKEEAGVAIEPGYVGAGA